MRSAEVYWHYDEGGRLLYVGMSLSAAVRTGEHRRSSEWFSRVRRIDVDHYESEWAARVAEAEAIAEHRPPFNRAPGVVVGDGALARWRRDNGWSRRALSRELGCSYNALSGWERSGAPPYIALALAAIEAGAGPEPDVERRPE